VSAVELRAEPVEAQERTLRYTQGTSPQNHHVARGATLWFTGLPSSGKSTIAHALAKKLVAEGHRVQVLDGDEVRPYLSAGLGYSREDRDTNVRRIGWVARLLASHGVVVLVPVIAPYATARAAVRDDHQAAAVPFAEVYLSTSLEVAESRDVKGLYAKARRGELPGLTGVDDPYERPHHPELVIDTAHVDVDTAVEQSGALLAAITESTQTT
jgi:adenylylsulfate kinase